MKFGYIAMFKGRSIEIYASSLYTAKQEAIRLFNPRKNETGLVSIMLAEVNGKPVIHLGE